jgi:Beta-propeller repeat/Abnormal spindle-like microcephaly-assoc'd, ASPM-SPD-2-Hydin/Cep192 domain 4
MMFRQFPRAGWTTAAAVLVMGAGVIGNAPPKSRNVPPGTLPGARAAKARLERARLAPLAFEPNVGQVGGEGSARVKFVTRGHGYTLFLTPTEMVMRFRQTHQAPAGRGPKGENRKSKFDIQNSKLENRNSKLETRSSKFETRNSKIENRDSIVANQKSKLENPERAIENRQSRIGNRSSAIPSPELRVPSPESRVPGPLWLRFKGANRQARAVGLDKLPGRANYFTGRNPAKWRGNVATYGRVKLEGIYPGIDVVFYARGAELEYDFVVAPGADPRAISLEVETGNSKTDDEKSQFEIQNSKLEIRRSKIQDPSSQMRVAANGDLVIPTAGGEVRFRKPVVFEEKSDVGSRESEGERRPADHGLLTADCRQQTAGVQNPKSQMQNSKLLDGRYVLAAGNRIHFEIRGYDRSRRLVIDPVLSYSTYLGGSGYDAAAAVAVDASGNAYITGQTDSLDFPSSSAVQPSPGGGTCGGTLDASPCFDVFVTKLSASGSSVVYSTYLGGSGDDRGTGIAVDSAGNAYLTGITASSDFPLLKPWQSAYPGGNCGSATDPAPCFDAFAAKLNASGAALGYSTYLGGSAQNLAAGIALDAAGEATIVGSTSSEDFPTTAGAFQGAFAGGTLDAFVVRLSADGSKAVYSTLLGGGDEDRGLGVAVDAEANAYVTGSTASGDFHVRGALQPQNAGGTCGSTASPTACTDAFVAKLNASGTALDYSTYLGGTGGDTGNAVAVDAAGAAYVAGMTASADFPVTPGASQPSGGGVSVDAFVSKLTPDGSALAYSTYLGGIGQETAYGLAVDSAGQAYVTGYVNDAAFPVASPIQPKSGGFYDAFATKLNAAGSALIFSTYLGGSGNESGRGIAVDGAGDAYIAGETFSTDFPTASAPEPAYGGGSFDAFAAKFSSLALPVLKLAETQVLFPDQGVGTSSDPVPVLLKNEGDAPLEISGITVSGDFSKTNDCGPGLPPGGGCTLQITFTPADYGPRTGAVTLRDNAWGSPQVISLTGNGIPSPVVELSPASLAFPTQTVGTQSAAQSVTLTNAGTVTLDITGISTLGDFSVTNHCGTSVVAGGSCSLVITFSPQAAGGMAGQVTLTDNAPGSPQVITLTGTGTGPALTLSPTALDFGNQEVGTTSATKPVIVTSTGTTALSVAGIAASGDFSETNGCPASLAPGAQCTIKVSFSPTAAGLREGLISITDNAALSPQKAALSGNGVLPAASLSPTAISFGDQGMETASPPQSVTLTNTGGATMNVSGLAASGDFTETNNCGLSLAPGAGCAIQVTFAPTALGSRAGTLSITDDAPDSPQRVALEGNGVVAFSLASTPTQATVVMGTDSASFTVRATSDFQYSHAVSLGCDGDATIQCSFSPTTILPGDTSSLTVAKLSRAPGDSVTFDIQGSSAGQMSQLPLRVLIADFSLRALTPTVAVSAGQTAAFPLAVEPINGFSQPIALECSGAPPGGACSVSPATITPGGGGAASVTVTVTTSGRALDAQRIEGPMGRTPPEFAGWPWAILLFGLCLVAAGGLGKRRVRLLAAGVGVAFFLVLSPGCGGGGQGPVASFAGTQPGVYELKVQGTSGQLARTVSLSLQVN